MARWKRISPRRRGCSITSCRTASSSSTSTTRRGASSHRSPPVALQRTCIDAPRCTPRTFASVRGGASGRSSLGGERAPVRLPLIGDFNVINALGAAADGVRAGHARRANRGAACRRCRRCRDDSRWSARIADGAARLRAHARRARARAGRRAAVHARAADRACSAAAATATGASVPRWARIAEAKADLAIVTSDNPRTEDPESDSRRHRARDGRGRTTSASRIAAPRSRARWTSRTPTTSSCSRGRATRTIRCAERPR